MRPSIVLPVLITLLGGCSAAVRQPIQPPSNGEPDSALALKRVQLYEVGVGYFERAGKLSPGKDVLSLPASHVDDALKSLVILSDGAPLVVSGVEFESVLGQALARVQAGLPSDPKQALSYPMLLESLRGVRIEVIERNDKRTAGRLVDVVLVKPEPGRDCAACNKNDRPSAGDESARTESSASDTAGSGGLDAASKANGAGHVPHYVISLVQADGAIARFDAAALKSVRPIEPAIAKRIDSAVAAASGREAQSTRAIKIAAAADVPIRVGYVTETPVWRVTYRLILGKDAAQSALQGWVLVHNDSDERWHDVALEIINGKPESFIYPLTAPRYLRRNLNVPEEEMSTLPQLARKTPDQIWGDHDEPGDDIGEAYGAGGLGLSGTGEGGGGTGYGEGHGVVSSRFSSGLPTSELTVGNLASLAPSEAMASGANFRYRIGQPVTLSAHSSALVPFTQIPVKAELLTRFGWNSSEGNVSVQINNGSGQTLPAGPIAIYTADGLAGESTLTRLASGQSSWLSYGTDLDTEIERRDGDVERVTTKILRFENQSQLVEHYVRHRERKVHLVNRSTLKRRICIELPVGSNAQVVGADRLEFDPSVGRPLGLFELGPRSDLDRSLVLEEALKKATSLDKLGERQFADLLANKELDPKVRSILIEAMAFLAKNTSRHQKLNNIQQQLERLEADTKRIEDKIEKLKGIEGNAAEPLVRRVVELESNRHRLENAQKAETDAQAAELPALAKILERLNGV